MLEESQGWWDRDVDHQGQRIRSDVRTAAHEIWQRVRSQAEYVLGDSAAAGELMELTVAQASRYLDRQGIPLGSQSHVGLLLVTFWRLLERRRAKLSRVEPIGDIGDLSERLPDRTWSSQIDRRLDSDKIIRLLSERGRSILALRSAGYEWSDIATLHNTPVAVVKGGFWREIRQIRRKIASTKNHRNERR
jgi:DNA-directed RNA polymerase specialized sigma24 family protein